MLRDGAQNQFISRRVSMPTEKSHAELVRDVDAGVKARSFFSARVADARRLENMRKISDAYSRGEMSLGEARNILKESLQAEGFNPHEGGLRNLAGTARLNLILRQNASMAHAAGEWARMHDPDAMAVFPYVRYHARSDRRTRSEHAHLDGKIFRKDDPFLRTHTPPWEFNCRCWLEEITAKAAGKTPELIQKPTPADKVTVDSRSGFVFDPARAFEEFDLGRLELMSRANIVKQAEEAVKDKRLGSVGLIVAPPISGERLVDLPNLNRVKSGFEAMKEAARQEIKAVGLDPDNLPDYLTVNKTFEDAGKQGKNIPGAVADKFLKEPFEVAKLNRRAAVSAGLPEDVPVLLGRGNSHNGIEHLWRNHKELFVDPDAAIRLLQETLGNQNCRVVVSLKRAMIKVPSHGGVNKVPICLKRIVLHNPETQAYCVLVWDGKELKLVSWNNAGDDYGNSEWVLQ